VENVSHLDEVDALRDLGARDVTDGPVSVSDLFRAHHRRLVGLASLLVDDRGSAEEVVQDAFLSLHRKYGSLRDPSLALTYLNRSVVNGARDRLRRKQRFVGVALRVRPVSEELGSAEQSAVRHEQSERLWLAIGGLSRRQREVLVLRYYLDQTEAEIAEVLGVSKGSVKVHASRGLTALAHRLEADR
jgi:RNA polymerase sigma-70 factor (sigma-E family)